MITLPIRDVRPATPRARIVRLALRGAAFPYRAGQAVLLGAHGGEVRRPYSLAGSPEESQRDDCLELLIGVDAAESPGAHLTLQSGERVDVDGPRGTFTFPLNPEERRFVFIAGGTGIAPLRSMLHHALTLPHQEIGVYYSARTPDEFAYDDELKALASAGRIAFRQTVTRAGGESWEGARGRIGRAELQALVHDPATLCFVCGPPSLVDDVPKMLGELGVERHRIRIEEW